MAGSDEFKKGLSLAQRNENARERIAADPERAAARLGMVGNKYDLSGYSDKDIIMAFQGGKFAEDDYSRLTGKPIAALAPTEPAPTKPKNPANDIGTEPAGSSAPVMESPFELRPEPTSPVFEVPVIPPIEEEAPVFIIGGNTGPFNARDINATIGKQGDIGPTTITNSQVGSGASIGNDYSQTRGSMMFGNSLLLPRQLRAKEGAFAGLRFS